ncbi:MAG: undecaprenyl-diphosphate phosphatase [Methanosarcina sp.]|nr:UDP-diphosphatase [Methanosarcina sp. Ant1]
MLTYFEAAVLGIIQGITEWLPISSKAMTSLVMIKFFGQPLSEALPFAIWMHIGTLLASVIYFREELKKIIKRLPVYFSETILSGRLNKKMDFKTKENEEDSLISFLIIATFLTGIIGLPIMLFVVKKAQISGELATAAIGIFLILTGLLQRISADAKSMKKLPDKRDAFIVGIGQGFAAIPGISRSGTTTGLFLFRKFDSENALKYSYLMSVPAVLGAEIVLQIMDIVKVDFTSLLAVVFSFIFGLLTIDIFLKVARKVNFSNFCIILGLMTILSLLL